MKTKFQDKIIALSALFLLIWSGYYYAWGRHLYLVTAYCNCPICINVKRYRDDQFASGRKIYWGGIAADRKIPFGTAVDLVPAWPTDFWKIDRILNNRRNFKVEDRGGKIRGRHIDIFIPDSMGGHKTAMKWGRQKMRLRINGELAD